MSIREVNAAMISQHSPFPHIIVCRTVRLRFAGLADLLWQNHNPSTGSSPDLKSQVSIRWTYLRMRSECCATVMVAAVSEEECTKADIGYTIESSPFFAFPGMSARI